LYVLACVFIILVMSLNFIDELVAERDWIVNVTAVIAIMTLVMVGGYH